MTIEASVRIIPPVVVALHPLARGAVIREGDVELQQLAGSMSPGSAEKSPAPCTRSRKRSATSWSAPWRPAPRSRPTASVSRWPFIAARSSPFTPRAGPIRIRTNARARDEGSVGELVAVESLLNRSTYYARVSGIREVEVYARPPRVENQPAEN